MKDIKELKLESVQQFPIAKGGNAWVRIELYGEIDTPAIDRLIEMLVEARNNQ